MKHFLSALVLAAVASQTTAQKCYSTDGQQLDSRYQPCYPDAESSGCCMLNGTQGSDQQNDLCLDTGLCQSTSGWYAGFLYINGCTDQSGKAQGCAQLCSFRNQYSWNVLQCEPGKFCCRAASDKENCCNNNQTMISTSHIGNLLLPGSTSAVNTTFNVTTNTPSVANSSSVENSTCTATTPSNSSLIDSSQCPADKSATVGGAVGGILGAALIGAIIALVLTLQSRKHTKSALTTAETRAAEEKANHQKQLEDQQRHVQTMPPNYPNTHYSQNGGYPTRPALPNEMDSSESHVYSELAGADGSRVELTSETARTK